MMHPSINSLVEGKVTVSKIDNKVPGHQSSNPVFNGLVGTSSTSSTAGLARTNSKRMSKEFANTTPSEALTKVLQDDPMRRRFRRYLQTLKMEENVRFWDSVLMFRSEADAHRRYVSARAIIQTFVLDSSPLQVNLSSATKQVITGAFASNDKSQLSSSDFFQSATNELFEDLRQSDAFRKFLENDTFSSDNVGSEPLPLRIGPDGTIIPNRENTKSDPLVLVTDSK
jgi:Regulator of G protein signaling domain